MYRKFACAAIMALGFSLRIMAARGALWLDEAWSMVYAHMVPPFIGVFSSINHDNNHHLNSLWLQLVGVSAPPMLARLPSVIAGTLGVWVAWQIGALRNLAAAVVMALFVAVMPMLVMLGSEARGYALMILCFLGSVFVVRRWEAGLGKRTDARTLALLGGIGTLAHLFMAPAMLLLIAATWLDVVQMEGWKIATQRTRALFEPTLVIVVLIVGVIMGTAYVTAGGMILDGHHDFAWGEFGGALLQVMRLSSGIPLWLSPIAAVLITLSVSALYLARWLAWTKSRNATLPLLLLIAMPLGVALFHPPNSNYARYYVLISLGFLLTAGDVAGWLAHKRWLLGIATAIFVLPMLMIDAAFISESRGQLPVALETIRTAHPRGASVMLPTLRNKAVLEVLTAEQHYPLSLNVGECAPSDYLFLTPDSGVMLPASITICHTVWHAVASRIVKGPSGESWTLYAPVPAAAASR